MYIPPVAWMEGRNFALIDAKDGVARSYTAVPVNLDYAKRKRTLGSAIGLVWNGENHYDQAILDPTKPLPPVQSAWWLREAATIVSNDDHVLLHAQCSFEMWEGMPRVTMSPAATPGCHCPCKPLRVVALAQSPWSSPQRVFNLISPSPSPSPTYLFQCLLLKPPPLPPPTARPPSCA